MFLKSNLVIHLGSYDSNIQSSGSSAWPKLTEGVLLNSCHVLDAGSALCGDDRQLSHSEMSVNFTGHIDKQKRNI